MQGLVGAWADLSYGLVDLEPAGLMRAGEERRDPRGVSTETSRARWAYARPAWVHAPLTAIPIRLGAMWPAVAAPHSSVCVRERGLAWCACAVPVGGAEWLGVSCLMTDGETSPALLLRETRPQLPHTYPLHTFTHPFHNHNHNHTLSPCPPLVSARPERVPAWATMPASAVH